MKQATDEIQSLVESLLEQIKQSSGEDFASIHAIEYTTQVVAGTNFNVKCKCIAHDGQEKIKKVKIFKSLPHQNKDPVVTEVTHE